jgi:glucose-1-phosphate cytidylyltransferase
VKKFVIPPDEILDKMARVMNCIILAGGLGTRISEESGSRPKPMVEIGGKPVLWHVMKIYSAHGIRDFIICTGYKGYVIKEYFANYFLHMSDVTFDMQNNSMEVHQRNAEPWKVTVVDTGEATMTGGRLKRVQSYIPKETFCMTYGDGVGNVDITAVIKAHRGAGKKATRALWGHACGGQRGDPFCRKTRGGRRLDQWRFFCAGAKRTRFDFRR